MELEDLRDATGAYHRWIADTIARFGGFIGERGGSGVLAYFGYPAAHEDDAEQAVRAGLELCAAVRALRRPPVTAWALNQVARDHAADLSALFDADAELSRSQREGAGREIETPVDFQPLTKALHLLAGDLSVGR